MATTLNRANPSTAPDSSYGSGLQVRVRRTPTSEDGGFQLDVAFALEKGITILFGPSGAGKTTLLDCIAGLAHPDQGRIAAGAQVLFDSEEGINLSPTERKIGYVFQDLALFPHLSVEANVAYGLGGLRAEDRKLGLQSLSNRWVFQSCARGVRQSFPEENASGWLWPGRW